MMIVDVDYRAKHPETSVFQNFIVSLFNLTGTFLVILFFVKIVDRESFIDIGLRISSKIRDMVVGVFLGLFIMASAFIFLMLSDEIVFGNIKLDIKKLVYMLLLYIVVSLTEEILFRGYILRNFMYSFNRLYALLLSSVLFSIAHGINPNFDFQAFINLFLAGILLGISYTYTKNLWFPISLHFSWNFFQSLLGLNASENDPYSLIKFDTTGNSFINISHYTLDKSFLYTCTNIILIIYVLFWYRHKTKKKELLKQ